MKIAVLMGGHSSEHQVSVKSGEHVAEALKPYADRVTPILVDENLKTWRIYDEPYHPTVGIKQLSSKFDVTFLALHGPWGEDGTIQGALEVVDARFTGSGVAASALAMNKAASNALMQTMDMPVPEFVAISKNNYRDYAEEIDKLGWPVILKPINAGSTIGVELIESADDLPGAVSKNPFIDLMVQRYIEGLEVSCTVLEITDKHGAEALPLVEIQYEGGLFSHERKYEQEDVKEVCPAENVSKKLTKQIQELAVKAHALHGCDGLTRVDFIIDKDNQPYILEINTTPGLTPQSLAPKAMEAAGLDFGETMFKLAERGTLDR